MLKGSCYCGGIRFETTGPHSKIGFCHCSRCRKCTGGAAAASVIVAFEHLRWLAGRDLLTAGPKHSFCRVCGSSMPDLNPRGTIYDIPAGCLDGDPKLAVSDHSWVGSKACWDVIGDDGAPRYEQYGPPLTRDQQA